MWLSRFKVCPENGWQSRVPQVRSNGWNMTDLCQRKVRQDKTDFENIDKGSKYGKVHEICCDGSAYLSLIQRWHFWNFAVFFSHIS